MNMTKNEDANGHPCRTPHEIVTVSDIVSVLMITIVDSRTSEPN